MGNLVAPKTPAVASYDKLHTSIYDVAWHYLTHNSEAILQVSSEELHDALDRAISKLNREGKQ